jgi:hypothetical protein
METMTPPPPVSAPAAPVAAPTPKASKGDWIGGVLISLLLPIIGLIVGIIYVSKTGPKRDVGKLCIALSLVAGGVYFALTR